MAKVLNRKQELVDFEAEKIESAILKAMKNGSGIVKPTIAKDIAKEIEKEANEEFTLDIKEIEQMVFDKLIARKQRLTARSYESYRSVKEFKRSENHLDKTIDSIIDASDANIIDENSNKNCLIASTQRDLIAGENSRDKTRRELLPANITDAHDSGIIHFHDSDYFLQHIFNCCLDNVKDCLDLGTVINGKKIDTPKSFQTACTLTTQIVQQIACGQYGGQTFSLAHLSKYVRASKEKWIQKTKVDIEAFKELFPDYEGFVNTIAMRRLKEEVTAGIQTIQYQINTFNTSNGQSPFLSIFMYLNEEPEYIDETAMLIEEVLKQRYQGMKNEKGVYVSPAFPKLLYVLDENNVHKDSKYSYLTDLACTCVAKRMMPDFISAKIMKENYEGQVFPCMGCRSFLAPWKDKDGNYKFYGRFNQGVVTLNLVDVALTAVTSADTDLTEEGRMKEFWDVLSTRLDLCYQALMIRHERLENTSTKISPIHWQHGAIARLSKDGNFNELLHGGYSSISLGYAGLYECVMALIGKSLSSNEGRVLGKVIMKKLKDACDKWKKETGIGFAVYGTPLESTTYKFAKCLKERFGEIPGVTDRDFITNSYHIHVEEPIDPFLKLEIESEFQRFSPGGSVSYIETVNLTKNIDVVRTFVEYIYDTIQYAEFNTKSDYCHECGFDGEIILNKDNQWECPNCGNHDRSKMNVVRRTCGYLGENFWNVGRTSEIGRRYVHVDSKMLEGWMEYANS